MGWNGLDLRNELAALLGDTSDTFKSRVMGWINDIEVDICTRHDWPSLIFKGQIASDDEKEEQTLSISRPDAPTAVIATGGSLIEASTYAVKIAFYQGASDTESFPSDASSTVTATATDKTVSLTDIDVSLDPLVTARRIYLSKDGGDYYLSATISDNTTTTASITSETSSLIEPCDNDYIKNISGQVFIESSTILRPYSIGQIRDFYPGDIELTAGTPYAYAMLNYNRILTYPAASGVTLSFYYVKTPRGIYASSDSVPTIPRMLKEVLYAGVEWKGYQYRDRSGKIEVLNYYNDLLTNAISRIGKADRQSYTVRDVVGDADGFSIN